MPLSDYDRANFEEVLNTGTWWTSKLLRLICDGDMQHRALMERAFPEEVALVNHHTRGCSVCQSSKFDYNEQTRVTRCRGCGTVVFARGGE